MKELQKVFNYSGHDVRTAVRNGEPWFIAKDVCEVLEIGNPSEALKRLDEDEKALISTEGFRGSVNIVNEPGLYTLILGSRKTEAKQFKRWITHEVIPSIRKNGAYMTGETLEKALTSPDFLIDLATRLKEEQTKRLEAEQKIAEQKPKVLFAEALETSNTSILIGELAKLLNQNGIDIGQNRLFEWLRKQGYLIRKQGEMFNLPTQYSMDIGLFEIKKRTINNPDGSVRTTRTPKVTGKGQVYFINKFLEQRQKKSLTR
ncbi:antirepressor [Bacillus sp. FJAT-18017]|uniref:phage antirepressor n=1 Tax=Bacillus sp. FJAT-18017 TaxID=1705566 RepID=UPI0006AEC090|nr:phage antirepressor [Bacillus sp. FJAT-18017]ALC92084.1 antirepressor [Bacillus sp. FJAT-18017]